MSYQPSNPNGQATMANSAPVVIASNQSAVPITDNSGSITVDGSVTVSGTVTANAGTGTMNVSVQNASIPVTDNGGSLTVDNGGTFAVQAAQSGNYVVRNQDGAGNNLASSTTTPVGTEQALIVRNIPSGTQTISGTVTANAGTGTMNVSVQNASIPVTGTFFQATQPISGTVTANAGTGSFTVAQATAANLNATVTGTVTANAGTGTMNVSVQNTSIPVTDNGGSLTVDGTVAATQSGTWTLGANSGIDIGDVTINNTQAERVYVQMTDGTNSIPVDTAHNDGESNTENHLDVAAKAMLYNGSTWDRMRGDTTNGLDVDVTRVSGNVSVVGTASTPVPVQIINTSRTELRFYAVAAAAGTTGTETAITLTRSSGTSATTTGTSHVVTNGKRFKINQIIFATRGNATATAQTTTFNFRINTAGAVTTTSTPIILAARSATPATANAWDRNTITLPGDGIEIVGDGTLQFGITAAATYTTNAPTWDVVIIGYEY